MKNFFSSLLIFLLTLGLSISLQSLLAAWTGPTTTPPGGNASGAINIGSIGQSKVGGLILNTGGSTNGLIVQSGNVGIDTLSTNESLTINGAISLAEGSTIPASTAGFGKIYIKNTPSGLDSYTKLLMHFDGTGNNFIDSAVTPKTITANGDVTQSSVQYKFGNISGYFDGSGDYISLANSSDWDFSTGDFTIDFWAKLSDYGHASSYDNFLSFGSGYYPQFGLHIKDSGMISVLYSGAELFDTGKTVTDSSWHHFALIRSGGVIKFFLDGNIAGSTYSLSSLNLSSYSLYIGGNPTANTTIIGYIDEFRVSKGIARWTSNFTPSSAPYSSGGYVPFYKDSSGNEIQLGGSGGVVSSSVWGQSGNDIYYNVGNVGIGVTSPAQKLDVAGAIAISGSTVIDSARNWQGGTIPYTKGGTGLTSLCSNGQILKSNGSSWSCGSDSTGASVLYSWTVQVTPGASQGNASNPRYVSQDITDVIKANCNVITTDGTYNRCVLFTNEIRTTYPSETNFSHEIAYYPAPGSIGNYMERLRGLKLDDFGSNFGVYTDGSIQGISANGQGPGWSPGGPGWAICEQYGDSTGTLQNGTDGRYYLLVDRLDSYTTYLIFKLVKF